MWPNHREKCGFGHIYWNDTVNTNHAVAVGAYATLATVFLLENHSEI